MKRIATTTVIALFILSACNKQTNITNNYPNNRRPAFTVQGLTDVTLSATEPFAATSFAVKFEDSVSEKVVLDISELPAGIKIDNAWTKTGYPTFSSQIVFANDSANPATPGSYPVTLSCTGPISGTKTFTFNVKVLNERPWNVEFLDTFRKCYVAGKTDTFTQTIAADPQIGNRILFSNFANTGQAVSGMVYYDGAFWAYIVVPRQVRDTFAFTATGSVPLFNSGYLSLQVNQNGKTKTLYFR